MTIACRAANLAGDRGNAPRVLRDHRLPPTRSLDQDQNHYTEVALTSHHTCSSTGQSQLDAGELSTVPEQVGGGLGARTDVQAREDVVQVGSDGPF